MPFNLTIEQGLDCLSCHESDKCGEDCICPACWWPARYDAVERDLAADAWVLYAPLMKAMNDAGMNWGWATEEGYGKRVVCSLELLLPNSDAWCEVVRRGDKYLASHWRMTVGSREHNIAPEPLLLDEISATNPDEVINFIQNCHDANKENA